MSEKAYARYENRAASFLKSVAGLVRSETVFGIACSEERELGKEIQKARQNMEAAEESYCSILNEVVICGDWSSPDHERRLDTLKRKENDVDFYNLRIKELEGRRAAQRKIQRDAETSWKIFNRESRQYGPLLVSAAVPIARAFYFAASYW